MEYAIIMDVSGDVDVNIPENREIGFIPMEYSLGGEMRKCIGREKPELIHAFYEGQRAGELTRTSQISPFMYREYLMPYMKKGISVLYLCLSSGLSSTFDSACNAKIQLESEFPKARFCPVDTLAASGGMGVLAERAVRNRLNGMSLEDNYDDLTRAAGKLKHWFLVQDLMYLKRGGRVSAATAILGTALNVKPLLTINAEGKLDTVAKKRGEKLAAMYVLERFVEEYDPESGDAIYVIDADNPDTGAYLEAEIKKHYPDAPVRRSYLSPIIGAHTGPNMAAICYMGRENERIK